MTTGLFITTAYFKSNSPVATNLDDTLIQPYIVLSMDKYILPCLGTALYNSLINQISGTGFTNSNYQTLMNIYIQPALVWLVLGEGLEFFTMQVGNKGAQSKSSEYSKPAPEESIKRMEAKAMASGQYYCQRLTRYLFANTTLFSEFLNPGSTIDTIPPVITSYYSSITVPQFANFGNPYSADQSVPWWLFVPGGK